MDVLVPQSAVDHRPAAGVRRVAARAFRLDPLWCLVGGFWGWLIWACAGEWNENPDYSYGWFVPLLAAYFLWKRLEARSPGAVAVEGGPVWAWLVLGGAALAVLPLELVRLTPVYWRPNLWAIGILALGVTWAVAWLRGGRGLAAAFLFPGLFMFIAIPWPTFVEQRITFALMLRVAETSAGLMHFLGVPAIANGTTITLPTCVVGVEEACSGVRSLQTGLMIGLAAGEVLRLGGWGRGLLVGWAFVLALAGNQLRVLIMALAGLRGGAAGVAEIHDLAGYTVLGLLLGGVGLAAWLTGRWRATPPRMPSVAASLPWVAGRLPAWAVASMAFAGLLAAHGWYAINETAWVPSEEPLLQPVETGAYAVSREVPEAILQQLRPDVWSYIKAPMPSGRQSTAGYHFFWKPRRGNANQLYHRPDRCMLGSGWSLDGKAVQREIKLGDGTTASFHLIPLQRPGMKALMLWGVWMNGQPLDLDFNNPVYLQTANLLGFIRSGRRTHSYEVAACLLVGRGGEPSVAELESMAAAMFARVPAESQPAAQQAGHSPGNSL